ncbi:hypothetical protein DMENIID0001_162800 [Sergentomyia squamirostris]
MLHMYLSQQQEMDDGIVGGETGETIPFPTFSGVGGGVSKENTFQLYVMIPRGCYLNKHPLMKKKSDNKDTLIRFCYFRA